MAYEITSDIDGFWCASATRQTNSLKKQGGHESELPSFAGGEGGRWNSPPRSPSVEAPVAPCWCPYGLSRPLDVCDLLFAFAPWFQATIAIHFLCQIIAMQVSSESRKTSLSNPWYGGKSCLFAAPPTSPQDEQKKCQQQRI